MEQQHRKVSVRLYEIDLLRFLAALAVVFFHYTHCGYEEGNLSPIPFLELSPITKYGYLGVELFFIISGYVVLLSAQGKTVRQFFLSRIIRLFPAFWVACTLTFVVQKIWGPGPTDIHMSPLLTANISHYLYNMTMLYDFFGIPALDGSYWSLTTEITFYFLVSLLISYKLVHRIDFVLIAWLGLVMLPGWNKGFGPFAFLFIIGYAPYFIAGMLFYLIQQPGGRTWFRYVLLGVAYILAIRTGFSKAAVLTTTYHGVLSRGVVITVITCFFLLFLLITLGKTDLSRLTWLSWLGSLTYPLYLVHGSIGFIIFHRVGHLMNKYILLVATLGLMLMVAYLIHVLIEKRYSKKLGTQVAKLLTYFDV
ncbi:acyltransferase [Hymenobacter sp. BT507]|uniref:Acyltransferase n=1 Tax=Hymenobacter citatus TaxID=2763506 RepID=A0ABR7MEA7_9BACT|nr:acyltransferase [Hymenobacter citatus]MBC6609409.1 acyltransferase [Hymenobacter citatus]